MFGVADSSMGRTLGYLVVCGLALAASRREDPHSVGAWRPFWPMTALLFAGMAIGRAGDLGDLATALFRDHAIADGWYESRRPLQGAIVLVIAVAWLLVVLVACWRVPERRRRYLPMIVMAVTFIAFAAVRLVSLHQIDAVLYRRHLGPARIATVVEWVLLVAAGALTLWTPAVVRRARATRYRGFAPAAAPRVGPEGGTP